MKINLNMLIYILIIFIISSKTLQSKNFGDLTKQGKKPLPQRNLEDCIFVLEPLVELSPKEVHPVQKKTFKEILDNIDQ